MTPWENKVLDMDTVRRDRNQAAKGFPFKLLRETIATPPTKRHLIKGIFARGETSAWIGAPGSLKSALMASAALAVASGSDWFGRRNKEQCGVVYFALERADLVERRLTVATANLEIPVAIVRGVIDLKSGQSVARVISTINEAAEAFGCPVGLVVFDTFAKLIAAAGLDEDKAAHQGLIFANIERIKSRLDCHVALVGHTGKNEDRGARGSNAILGDVDLMVKIEGSEIKTATVTKANDAPEGPLFKFRSELCDLGTDEDGDPITINIAIQTDETAQGNRSNEPKLSPNQRVMYRLLAEAGAAGLTKDEWNEQARENGITAKQRIYEIRMSLKDRGLVREYGGVWKVNQG